MSTLHLYFKLYFDYYRRKIKMEKNCNDSRLDNSKNHK